MHEPGRDLDAPGSTALLYRVATPGGPPPVPPPLPAAAPVPGSAPPPGPLPVPAPSPLPPTSQPLPVPPGAGAENIGADAAAAEGAAPAAGEDDAPEDGQDDAASGPARPTLHVPLLGDVPRPSRRHVGTVVAALSLVPAATATRWGRDLVGDRWDDGGPEERTRPVNGVALAANVEPEQLLARVTYAATPVLRTELSRTGMSAWLAQQLAPAGIPDPEGDAVLAAFPLLGMSPKELQDLMQRRQGAQIDAPLDLQAAHIGRALWSRRQLFEVMVNFWSDHFTVPVTANRAELFRADYDARVIRRYALGRFEDLLVAVANHPAMMLYLNLSGSTKKAPNENFGRELLELHTIGVDGGYHEADVKQAAKALTGMLVEDDTSVTYHPRDHYVGPIRVMGFSSANGNRANGRQVARALYKYLAHHPSTAKRLATKLARRFVSDTPPDTLVTHLASVYLANDTRIVPVLTALFDSPEFAASGGQKLRRPMEFVVAVGRTLGLKPGPDPDGLRDLAKALDEVGHAPFRWSTPNGYPDVASAWQSAGQALNQWRLMARFLGGPDEHGIGVSNASKLLTAPALATTPATIADQLARRYLGRPPTAAELAAVRLALPAKAYPKRLKPGSQSQQKAVVNATFVLLQSTTFLTR